MKNNFGYPAIGDNVRRKNATLYDNGTLATATKEYPLFINPALSVYNRNRNFPLSGMEVFFINNIRVWMGLTYAHIMLPTIFTLLKTSYIEIAVNERQKLKIPLLECLSFEIGDALGATATTAIYDNTKIINRRRKLQYPIIINANDNVNVTLVYSSGATFNNVPFMVFLDGVKYDKLNNFDVDFVQGNNLERLSYSMYEVQTLAATEETLNFFVTRNQAANLFSKNIPLSDKESFQIEAIEIFTQGAVALNQMTDVLNELYKFSLEISVDDVKFYEGKSPEMFSAGYTGEHFIVDGGPDTASVTVCKLHTSNYVLPEPIIIPANSKAAVKLRHGALTSISGTVLVDFKGTLIREVA